MENASQTGPCLDGQRDDGLSVLDCVITAAEVVLMFLICFGNGLVMAAFLRSKSIRNMTNYYIFQMAIADLGLGLTLTFHVATQFRTEILRSVYFCGLKFCALLTSGSASVLLTISLTLDRYLSITRPLRYDNAMTKKRVALVTTSTWALPFAVNFLIPMFWHNPEYGRCTECNFTEVVNISYLRYVLIPAAYGALFINIALYSRIFFVAVRQQRNIASEQRATVGVVVGKHVSGPASHKNQLKVVKTAFLICLSALGLWMPYFAVLTVEVFQPGMLHDDRVKRVRAVMTLMSVANSAINPLIYTMRLAKFRREIRDLLRLQNNRVQQFSS